jgi:uracil-DNA glycosylase
MTSDPIRDAARAQLEHLQRMGVLVAPRPRASVPTSVAAAVSPPATAATATKVSLGAATEVRAEQSASVLEQATTTTTHTEIAAPSVPLGVEVIPFQYGQPPLDPIARLPQLAVLQQEVVGCTRCPELVRYRKQTVFGEGTLSPRICFFGEAPGADEDRLGRPFVGASGQLLDKMIIACGLKREDVYILNTVKCRPPENRTPESNEVRNCMPFFRRQLEILQPAFIVCLGVVAANALLCNKLSVGKMRGRVHRYAGSSVIVTYHPSYLLRTPSAKAAAWDDLKLLIREASLTSPAVRDASS